MSLTISTQANSNEVATEVVPAHVQVTVIGDTVAERKLSVITQGASQATLLALSGATGKIGKAAREQASIVGMNDVAKHAANSNFRPLAELYSATTGYNITIANRAAFENLPSVIDALIEVATSTKTKGMTTKDGVSVPGAKLKSLMGIRAVAVECIDFAAKVHAARMAKRLEQEQQAS